MNASIYGCFSGTWHDCMSYMRARPWEMATRVSPQLPKPSTLNPNLQALGVGHSRIATVA